MGGNGDEGFLMEGGKRFQLRGNRFAANGGGITLGPGTRNVITKNHLSGGRDGIRFEKGHGNLIADNVVVHAAGRASASGSRIPSSAARTTSSAETWSGRAGWTASWSTRRTTTAS